MRWSWVTLVVFFICSGLCCAAPKYSIVELGQYGLEGCVPCGINNQGDITGYYTHPVQRTSHAFLLKNSVLTDIHLSGYTCGSGWGINDHDQVVGYFLKRFPGYPTQPDVELGFRYENGQITILDSPTTVSVQPRRINNNGITVGTMRIMLTPQNPYDPAVMWDTDGNMHDLGVFSGAAQDINDSDVIVGHSNLQAVYWTQGSIQTLPTPTDSFSYANGINNYGQIIGYYYFNNGPFYAVMWDQGSMIDLGNLGGSTRPEAINNRGQIVGMSKTWIGIETPFLWENGTMKSLYNLLPTSEWTITCIHDINDNGQIVACGYKTDQWHSQGLLLNPILEPSSLLALGAGITTLTLLKRRRKG